MSILIKGMKMPKDKDVILRIDSKGEVYIYGDYPTKIHEAVELPDHGDLVEVERAYDEIAEQAGKGNYIDMDAVDAGLQNAPVIIHAEWSKE